jgi:uncharacterized protein involved in outer membrane biogenesis
VIKSFKNASTGANESPKERRPARRWKLFVGAALLLAILLVAALYLFLATYDYNRLKPEIIRAVRDATGRELTLGGDIELAIGLSPALTVKDVRFANAAWGSRPQMLTAGRIEAQVGLLPLLRRDIEFERIVLVGVDLFLETDPAGRGNWVFEGVSGGGKSLETGMHIEVASVTIKKLNFAFHDGRTGSTTRFTLAGLDAAQSPSANQLAVKINGTWNGQPAELAGKIGSIGYLIGGKPFPLDLTGEVSDAKIKVEGAIGDIPNLHGIDLNVQASGTNLAGVGHMIAIALPKTDAFTVAGRLQGSAEALTLADARGKVSRGSVELTVNGAVGDVITLRDIRLDFTGSGKELAEIGPIVDVKLPKTGPFTVKGRLTGSLKALSLTEAQATVSRESLSVDATGGIKNLLSLSGIDVNLTGSGKDLAEIGPIVDVKLPKTGPFTVKGRLTGSLKSLSLTAAQATVSRESLKLAAHGKIDDLLSFKGIDFEVKATGMEFGEIGALTSTKLPALGSFDLSGRLTGSRTALALDGLSAVVGKSDLKGSGKVEFRKRPKITLVLASGMIDFTPFIPESKKEEKQLGQKGGFTHPLFPDDPLPFRLLAKVDVDIALNARHIQVREAGLELGRLSLTLNDSELAIKTLEAVYKGAKISGHAHFYPGSPPTITAKFLVQNFDLGGFLKETSVTDDVEEHLDIAVDLKSRGDSLHSLMASLDGTAGAVIGKGYASKYLDLLGMDLSRKVIPFWGRHKEAGRIKCGVVQFDIKNGLATSQAFVFNTKLTVLTGEGDINLATEQVNFLLSPEPKRFSLFSLSTKLRVEGSLQDPMVRPDMTSLATKGIKSLSALVVGPLGLLAPFVNLGAHERHPCDIRGAGK